MNSRIIVAAVLMASGAIFAYSHWKENQKSLLLQTTQRLSILPAVTPASRPLRILDKPEIVESLPLLEQSDNFFFNALSELIKNKTLLSLFYNEHMIHNIVAAIDNRPERSVPANVMPVGSPAGKFSASATQGGLVVGEENAVRYTRYVKLTEGIKPEELVELYIRLYPLFQQAYEKTGYPKKHFNDRFVVVLDDLLAAPDVEDTIGLVRPRVYYQFADNDLESRSIGQRTLMRTGSKNEAALKGWLGEIKKQLPLLMH